MIAEELGNFAAGLQTGAAGIDVMLRCKLNSSKHALFLAGPAAGIPMRTLCHYFEQQWGSSSGSSFEPIGGHQLPAEGLGAAAIGSSAPRTRVSDAFAGETRNPFYQRNNGENGPMVDRAHCADLCDKISLVVLDDTPPVDPEIALTEVVTDTHHVGEQVAVL